METSVPWRKTSLNRKCCSSALAAEPSYPQGLGVFPLGDDPEEQVSWLAKIP